MFPSLGRPLGTCVDRRQAVAAEEACTDEYREYIHAVVRNCRAMCEEFRKMGYDVVTGGTDNHLFLLDLTKTGLTGKAVKG